MVKLLTLHLFSKIWGNLNSVFQRKREKIATSIYCIEGYLSCLWYSKFWSRFNWYFYKVLVGISFQKDSKFNHRCKTKLKVIEFKEGSFKLSPGFLMVQIARYLFESDQFFWLYNWCLYNGAIFISSNMKKRTKPWEKAFPQYKNGFLINECYEGCNWIVKVLCISETNEFHLNCGCIKRRFKLHNRQPILD